MKKLKAKHPDWTQSKIEEEANKMVANPYGIGSGHQTGGAIDVTLSYLGQMLDMGTPYLSDEVQTRTDYPFLTPTQIQNRRLLKGTLEKVGLVNYPLEWWHYSYGEQEWAVLTKQPQTLFAPVILKQKGGQNG